MNVKTMWLHFKTISKHKMIVGRECMACGQIIRGIMHDNSKYSITEFAPSARFFQGDKSPIDEEKAKRGYSLAWQHHKGHNPHHWEYWTDFDSDGQIIANKIPYKYVVEMVCDWVGAGMVYSKQRWSQKEPLNYYRRVRKGRHFNPDTEVLIESFLLCIARDGLNEFHKMARGKGKHGYVVQVYRMEVSEDA